MIADIVLDTNVLVHAENPAEQRCEASRCLLQRMLLVDTHLCVDEGFHLIEAMNRSRISSEYLGHLRFGSMGFAVVAQLAAAGRIKVLSPKPGAAVAKRIRQLIRNTTDRVFLAVSYASNEKLLVSHDYVDFQETKRETLRREFGVAVIEACVCNPRL